MENSTSENKGIAATLIRHDSKYMTSIINKHSIISIRLKIQTEIQDKLLVILFIRETNSLTRLVYHSKKALQLNAVQKKILISFLHNTHENLGPKVGIYLLPINLFNLPISTLL